jgi:hypothetical protein
METRTGSPTAVACWPQLQLARCSAALIGRILPDLTHDGNQSLGAIYAGRAIRFASIRSMNAVARATSLRHRRRTHPLAAAPGGRWTRAEVRSD